MESDSLHLRGSSTRDFARAVLLVTVIAGTLDIIAAHLHGWAASGRFPLAIFKTIAGGVVGREAAMQGGIGTMVLGGFLHYLISLGFTLLFFLLYPRVAALRKSLLASTTVYSLFVWFTMNCMVLPWSALNSPVPNFGSKHTYIGMGILIAAFGLPIVLGARRFFRERPI